MQTLHHVGFIVKYPIAYNYFSVLYDNRNNAYGNHIYGSHLQYQNYNLTMGQLNCTGYQLSRTAVRCSNQTHDIHLFSSNSFPFFFKIFCLAILLQHNNVVEIT